MREHAKKSWNHSGVGKKETDPASGLEASSALNWVHEQSRWHQQSESSWLGIDRIYAIALDERLERLQTALRANGIEESTSILKAFYKNDLDLAQLEQAGIIGRNSVAAKDELSQGADRDRGKIACTLSHLAVLLDFCESGQNTCLIFEDDIQLDDRRTDLRQFLNSIGALDWDMIYLSYSHARRKDSRNLGEGVWQIKGPLCLNAYILNRSSALHLLRTHIPYKKLVDELYQEVAERDSLMVIGPEERIFDQDRRAAGSLISASRSLLMAPQWKPSATDKVIARALSIGSLGRGLGYDEYLLRYNHLPYGYLSRLRERIPSLFRRSD